MHLRTFYRCALQKNTTVVKKNKTNKIQNIGLFLNLPCPAQFFLTVISVFVNACLGFSAAEFSLRPAALKTSGLWIINIYHSHILPSIILLNGMRFCHQPKKSRDGVYLWKRGRHCGGGVRHFICASSTLAVTFGAQMMISSLKYSA